MAENGAIIAIYGQTETFFVEIRPVAAVRGRSNPGALGLARDSFIDSPSVTGFGKVALMSGFFPGYRDPAVIEEVRGGAVSPMRTRLHLARLRQRIAALAADESD